MNGKKVIIIGDAILDHYLFCRQVIGRIEGSAPVLCEEYSQNCLGGAANVAQHVSVQIENVSLVTLFGNDKNGQILKDIIHQYCPGLKLLDYTTYNAPTVTKHRVLVNSSVQLARIDEERSELVSKKDQEIVLGLIKKELTKGTIVVISDYEKGCLSFSTCQKLINYANNAGCKVLVDGKHPDPCKYFNAYLLKPNRAELARMTKQQVNCIEDAVTSAQLLRKTAHCTWVLVTMDKDGMILVGDNYTQHISSQVNPEYSTIGAGDAIIAHIAIELAKSVPMEEIWIDANKAIADVFLQLNDRPRTLEFQTASTDKIISLSQLEDRLSRLRQHYSIVFTNGCFDIIHSGHILCLESAANCGDILVVGVNDDDSVRRIKGSCRPVNSLKDRMRVLSSLQCVSFVIPFSEDTPIGLIQKIRPDVLVKGGDYINKEIVGAEFVRSYGGKIVITSYDADHSTSQIITSIGGKKR